MLHKGACFVAPFFRLRTPSSRGRCFHSNSSLFFVVNAVCDGERIKRLKLDVQGLPRLRRAPLKIPIPSGFCEYARPWDKSQSDFIDRLCRSRQPTDTEVFEKLRMGTLDTRPRCAERRRLAVCAPARPLHGVF